MSEFTRVFERELIKAYVEEYGQEAWDRQSDEEQGQTLHELLYSFLTVTKKRAERQ